MEIDKLNYAKLIIACLSYFKFEEAVEYIFEENNDNRFIHISYVCDVARAFSVYANKNDGDKEDDILFLKFKEVLDADYTLEEKVDILLGLDEKNKLSDNGDTPFENEYEKLNMRILEMYYNQIMHNKSDTRY